MAEKLRLDKLLAASGYGTRSLVKKIIKEGRVSIHGEACRDPSMHADPAEVSVDGVPIHYEQYHYFMMNKPKGYVSATHDAAPTVLDLMHENIRGLFPCGRLDKDTTGLLLITDDGQLAHDLLSPRHHVDKTYEVHTREPISEKTIKDFHDGITIDGNEKCESAECGLLSEHACRLTIHEGKYHQVKRMFLAAGNEVLELKRIRMKNLVLDESLASGEYRKLTKEEIQDLKEPVHSF